MTSRERLLTAAIAAAAPGAFILGSACEVPGVSEQEMAKGWYELLCRKNYTDLLPWFPLGAEALREQLDIDALLMGDLKSILVDKRAFMSPRLEYGERFGSAPAAKARQDQSGQRMQKLAFSPGDLRRPCWPIHPSARTGDRRTSIPGADRTGHETRRQRIIVE